jgi:hypothetical protein
MHRLFLVEWPKVFTADVLNCGYITNGSICPIAVDIGSG